MRKTQIKQGQQISLGGVVRYVVLRTNSQGGAAIRPINVARGGIMYLHPDTKIQIIN